MKNANLLLSADSYKYSHPNMFPTEEGYLHLYIESRSTQGMNALFFGLQKEIKDSLLDLVTEADIDEAESYIKPHGLPFFRELYEDLLKRHGGRLPISIRALPEGTLVPSRTPMVTVTNTDPKALWLGPFLETLLLRAVWYPTTVATLSYNVRQSLLDYADQSGADPSVVDMQLHDFGGRGATTRESSAIAGLAHLVNFGGTDTVDALVAGRDYYHCDMAGHSVPAAEHTVLIAWGRHQETQAYQNIVDNYATPGAVFSVVSDSYDIYNAVESIWGEQLAQQVLDSGARLVVRPDSGDPVKVPLEVAEILGRKFGYTKNAKGYKVLADCVRILQGDGLNKDTLCQLCEQALKQGWSTENFVFGMGGGLHQKLDRGTLEFAMKGSFIEFMDGTTRDIFKDPVTDPGKKSKKGKLTVVRTPTGAYHTIDPARIENGEYAADMEVMREVYRDGELLIDEDLDTIRARARASEK